MDSHSNWTSFRGAGHYFDFFNDPISLFNYTFLYLLREFSCLFVGLSMQDENIRRLLHYSREERRQSHLKKHQLNIEKLGQSYVKKQRKLEDEAIETSCRHFAILQHSKSTAIDNAIETSLLALGTHVLWIANYDQIPTLLAKVYPSGSYKWDQVY